MEQLREVVRHFNLGTGAVLTRCVRCNLTLGSIDKESVKGRVPPFVYDTQESFCECRGCGRLYREGNPSGTYAKESVDYGRRYHSRE